MIYTKIGGDAHVWDDNQVDFIPKDHTVMTDEEIYTHLNPPAPPITMEMVNIAVQNLTNAQARAMGFENMIDAYNWVTFYQNTDAIRLQEWDKKCWDAVDDLNDQPPLQISDFIASLKF